MCSHVVCELHALVTGGERLQVEVFTLPFLLGAYTIHQHALHDSAQVKRIFAGVTRSSTSMDM